MNKVKKCFKRHIRSVVSMFAAASMFLPSAFASYTATVKADALNMRQSPGGTIITTIPNGTKVSVIDNEGEWCKIVFGGKEGYVSSSYLIENKESSVTSPVATPTASVQTPVNKSAPAPAKDESAAGSTGRITCSTSVNLREQPNTSCEIIGEIINGTVVVITGKSDDWYCVSYNGKSGYVHPDYIKVGGADTFDASGKYVTSVVKPAANAVSFNGSQSKRAEVLAFASNFLGTPYSYGGSTPNGFDCSGFVYYVFGNTVGSLPRIAQSQYDATTRVSREELIPGDLVFFGSSGYSISHVGIYTGKNADGEDEFIHSPHTGDVVKYDTLTGSYGGRFQGGGRVIFD